MMESTRREKEKGNLKRGLAGEKTQQKLKT